MLLLPVLALFLLQSPQAHHAPSDPIDEDDLHQYLAKQNGCEYDQIYVSKLEAHDFLGKGYPQFAVVAGTCMTGTAGPDVHSVFTRNANGDLQELKMESPKLPNVLFGNSNSLFTIENGLLVDNFYDTSDREHPLIVKYKWDAPRDQFSVVEVIAAKPFRSSYDCSRAQQETERAICYVESLAELDVELAQVYKSLLNGRDETQRKAAIEEQRAWLVQRNQKCTIYKWWVECLTEEYKSRIAELRAKLPAPNDRPSSGKPGKPQSE